MRTLFVVILIVGSIPAFAQGYDTLQGGTARSGRFQVTVSRPARERISYEIRSGATILHRITSSYTPEPDDSTWAWRQASSAEVYWSPDDHYVVIDEAPWHHGGSVLLVEVRRDGYVSTVRLPTDAMVASTKLRWDRYRIRVQRGWTSNHDLSLVFGGYAIKEYLPDGRHLSYDRTFEISIHFQQHRAYVTGSHEISEKA